MAQDKPLPRWLRVVAWVNAVSNVVLTALALFWHSLFWLPLIAVWLVSAYLFIVARGTSRELKEWPSGDGP